MKMIMIMIMVITRYLGCYSKSHFWAKLDKNKESDLCSDNEISNDNSEWDQKESAALSSGEVKKSHHHVNSSRALSMNVSTLPSGQVVSVLTHMNTHTVGARRTAICTDWASRGQWQDTSKHCRHMNTCMHACVGRDWRTYPLPW